MPGPYVEIKWKRARDLTDRDVIRLHDSKLPDSRRPPWREVLDVFHDEDEVLAAFRPDGPHEPDFRPHQARLKTGQYTALRLKLQDQCQEGEIADGWVSLFHFDLVEVQDLPAWEPAAEALKG